MRDDLIKRSDAIKVVWGEDINPSEDGVVFEAQSHIDRDIRLIPSADRPQGEWIEQEDCWQCSECGDEYVLEVDVKPIDAKMYYCPNCGAQMKGADDE